MVNKKFSKKTLIIVENSIVTSLELQKKLEDIGYIIKGKSYDNQAAKAFLQAYKNGKFDKILY